jgi:hypothetical protein
VEYIAWYNGTRLHSTIGHDHAADRDANQDELVELGS